MIAMCDLAMNAFAEGYAEESVRQFKADLKMDNAAAFISEKAKEYSRSVNSFCFNPKEFVERMKKADRRFFISVSRYFIPLMASKRYTDARNECAKRSCVRYMSIHPELEIPGKIYVHFAKDITVEYVKNDVRNIRGYLTTGSYKGDEKAVLTALILLNEHPTLQQTFTQACLYAQMVANGEEESVINRDYSLPLI